MKTVVRTTLVALTVTTAIISCKKETPTPTSPVVQATQSTDHYKSLGDFFSKNGESMQIYTVNGSTGGSFTSPNGSKVIVPANCFVDKSGNKVTGPVVIEFKDIYTKSDMLLSNMPTNTNLGTPLKSAGEFFIRAKANGNVVLLNGASSIKVLQPAATIDTGMAAFTNAKDTAGGHGWTPSYGDPIYDSLNQYVYSLYQFNTPADSGSWCNTDNQSYFSAYTQVPITMQTTDTLGYGTTAVYLFFSGINSMVESDYNNVTGNITQFPYPYAPLGMKCTVVALEVKPNGSIYSAFVPITISNNLTVNFTATKTTTADFVKALKALN